MNIPTSYLINNGYNKSILRDAMKGILHDDVRLFREKRGFNASINTLFNLNSKKFKAFIDKDSAIYSILNKDKLIKIIEMNNNTNMYSKFIFNVICSKMFLDMKE
jgi:asparagine synthase (glutamine-hydrolysing)